MSQSNYPYYNYQAQPQAYTPNGTPTRQSPYANGATGQTPAGYAPTQMPYPYTQPVGQMQQQPVGIGPTPTGGINVPGMLPAEVSYIENILRLNKGKLVTVYMSFEGSREWNSKIFKGIIEAAGRDHSILSDPQTGMRHLLLMVYLDYVTFDEEIEYNYPFGAAGSGIASYPPR